MNVLMLLFKDLHNDARVVREANALAKKGYIVHIACLQEYDHEPKEELHENVYVNRIPIISKKAKKSLGGYKPSQTRNKTSLAFKIIRSPYIKLAKDFTGYGEFYRKILKSYNQMNFKVVHCHDLNTLPTGYYLSRKFQAKLLFDAHELFNEMSGRNELDRTIGYKLEEYFLPKADQVITVNPFMEEEMKKKYGNFPSTILQNTPEDIVEEEGRAVPDLRSLYGLSNNDILLIYQGGLSQQRGLDLCIEALRGLPDEYKMVYIGDGPLKESLKAKAEEEKVSDRFFLHEKVPAKDLLLYTKQADIGLVMYENLSKNNYYSTPNKIFEYMLAGIPAVASNHPGKSYIVTEEGTGVCTSEDAHSIAEAVMNIMEGYEHYKSTCLRKKSRFTWEVEQDKLVSLYKTLTK
ncbi:glycosyltransferase [Bacillus sp. FJAT-44742]|uniref:glycosyltransferase n=1 Tax=Bacillus sp. FJAT-44742 TaxID=2014005 RepID=UPI000C243878|nr:glycosyltransferase [Bacillus sp. FJAT-44742]